MKSRVKFNLDDSKKINELLNGYKFGYTMFIRLSVVKMVIDGFTRGEAAEKFHVHRKTAENWVKLYNENGISGLEPDYSNCGLNCKLSDEQLIELKDVVLNSSNKYTINDVRIFIKDKYDVQYTYKQVWFILRKKLGLNLKNKKVIA